MMKALKEKNQALMRERDEMRQMQEERDYDPFGK